MLSDAMLPAAPGPPPSSDSVLPFQGHGWASHCLLDTTPGCPPSTHTTVLTPRGSGSVSSSHYPTPSGREHVFPGSRGSAGQRPRGPGGEPRGAGGSHWQAPGTVCSEGPGPHRGPFTRGPWASHNNSVVWQSRPSRLNLSGLTEGVDSPEAALASGPSDRAQDGRDPQPPQPGLDISLPTNCQLPARSLAQRRTRGRRELRVRRSAAPAPEEPSPHGSS